MMTKAFEKLLEEFEKERKGWGNNPLAPGQYYEGLTYLLYKNKSVKIKDLYDFMLIYDNLVCNSEILTSENLAEYDLQKLCKYDNYRINYIKKKIAEGKHILLNYYTVTGGPFDCFIVFDPDYNIKEIKND